MSELTLYTREDVLAFLEEEARLSAKMRDQISESMRDAFSEMESRDVFHDMENRNANMLVTLTNIINMVDRQIRREHYIQLTTTAIFWSFVILMLSEFLL